MFLEASEYIQLVEKKAILAGSNIRTMMDHNVLRDEISVANRYRQLQDLKLTITGQRRKLPISISTELEARLSEKLRTFDYPICNAAKVKIIFSNGLSKDMDPDECQKAMGRGMKLSDYIFSRYISAKDFEILASDTIGTRNLGIYSDSTEEPTTSYSNLTPLSDTELRERIDFLVKKVESLEKLETIYAENIPKMARDVNDMKEKIDKIYKRILNS